MKKIFMIICLFCGFAGNSWAVCELTESTDRTPSDEDLYPQNPNESRMALICQKGKCEDGEIVYIGGIHYIGNVFNSKGFTTVNKDDTIYKCKLGGNDRWVEATSSDIPVSTDPQDLIMADHIFWKEMYFRGKKASDGDYYTNVHYYEGDEKCGVECSVSTYIKDEGKVLLCDKEILYCSEDSLLWEKFNGVDQICDYVSPEHVASGYTYVGVLKDGYSAYTNKSNAITGMVNENDLCWGCPAGEPFSDGTGYCRDNLGEAWCYWRENRENKNTEWEDDECKCLDDGMEWNTEQHDCVKSGKGGKTGGKTGASIGGGKTGGKTGNKTGVNTGKVNKTCAEMYPGNAEAIACCEFGKNGGAEWKDNKCNCFGANKKWEYSDNIKAGHCVDDKKTEEKPEKKPEVKNNNIDCVIELGASVQCKNGTKFNKNATVSLSAEKCNLYKSNVAKYLNEIAGMLCEKSGGVGNIITDAQVKAATDNINRFFAYAKSNANVWKNADGKFNTARLASDATAGVILGTVGGIVSAKIIKKKQVEKGFDALNCTVGGQKVADWGDEFTIGFGR